MTVRLARADRKSGRIAGPHTEPEQEKHETQEKRPAKFTDPGPTFQPNGNGGPPITGAQRIAIEEHFRRLDYSDQDILAHINGRFGKTRLTDLTVRQASDLLSELQRISIDPHRANQEKDSINATIHGRRGCKRNGR